MQVGLIVLHYSPTDTFAIQRKGLTTFTTTTILTIPNRALQPIQQKIINPLKLIPSLSTLTIAHTMLHQ